VFRHAVTNLRRVLGEVLDTGLSAADIDWVVPHQANKRRIIDATAKKLGLPAERVV
jgi:3-oxoacyl-[acyl-carrier-protein] synthase-3